MVGRCSVVGALRRRRGCSTAEARGGRHCGGPAGALGRRARLLRARPHRRREAVGACLFELLLPRPFRLHLQDMPVGAI